MAALRKGSTASYETVSSPRYLPKGTLSCKCRPDGRHPV
jgi:hypothetical protein